MVSSLRDFRQMLSAEWNPADPVRWRRETCLDLYGGEWLGEEKTTTGRGEWREEVAESETE